MQALGSYRGERMLFLGLGTGLGSALVWAKTLMPLELGDLPYRDIGHIIENYLGIPGVALLGREEMEAGGGMYAVTQLKKILRRRLRRARRRLSCTVSAGLPERNRSAGEMRMPS